MTPKTTSAVTLLGLVLWLAACATPKAERSGSWSYAFTALQPDWWTEVIHLKDAQAKPATGAGTIVAIVGTGVLKGHEDLGAILPGEATCGSKPDNTNDSNGHGTQLAGIAAGKNPGASTTGVAPDAALVPIKVDCGAGVTTEALTRGVDAAIARKPDVILLAFGGYPPAVDTFLLNRVSSNNRSILFVIASAWNGTSAPFPAWTQLDNALVVAAMTFDADKKDMRIADKSSEVPYDARRGQIWAPGREVGTADIDPPGAVKHNQFPMNGTSPAAAMVAGCALLVKGKGGTSGADLKTVLVRKADNPGIGPRLNCAAAVP